MSLEDRDWFREDHKEREERYGGDFSLHSKPIHKTSDSKRNGNIQYSEDKKPEYGYIVAASFYGAFITLALISKTQMAYPLIAVMLGYNIWMLVTVFRKKSHAGIGIKILAIFFFIFSEGIMGILAYFVLQKFVL